MRYVAAVAASALTLLACDQRTPTEPSVPAPQFDVKTTSQLRISGAWFIQGDGEIKVPYDVVGTLPPELCTSKVIVRMDNGNTGFDESTFLATSHTSQTAWRVKFGRLIDPTANTGTAEGSVLCDKSGFSEDVQQGHATRN